MLLLIDGVVESSPPSPKSWSIQSESMSGSTLHRLQVRVQLRIGVHYTNVNELSMYSLMISHLLIALCG